VVAFRLYTPAGITQVATAANTINANKIVYADGRVNRLFFSGSAAMEAAGSLIGSASCLNSASLRHLWIYSN
jgi:hypothetical protein